MPPVLRCSRRPRALTALLSSAALGLTLLAATPAAALDATQIEAAARRAPVGLREITTRLASDELEGRNNLTEGSRRTQDYLIGLLRELGPGVSGQTDDGAYRHPFEHGTNLAAVIRGRELPDEYVMIGGHYDHLGVSSSGAVYNGATDNAAGTAVALAVAGAIRSLPEPPRRSILIVLWDAEEDGLLGSLAWVANPPIPLERTVAYVNLDIQGVNLTPGLSRTSFAVGGETGGKELQDAIAAAVAGDVDRGPDAFTGADAGVLLNAAATTISFLESLECGGYFGRRGPYLVPGERGHGHDHGTRPPVEPRRLPLQRR